MICRVPIMLLTSYDILPNRTFVCCAKLIGSLSSLFIYNHEPYYGNAWSREG